MKKNDFGHHLSKFLTRYLPNELGLSYNTICSYRDTFVLFLKDFLHKVKQEKIERISLEKVNKVNVIEFLDWLQAVRKCGNSTRNNRLAAIHSFCKFILQDRSIEYLEECQEILSIRFKRQAEPEINYLTTDGIKLLMQQPDLSTWRGRRDLALLSLMYDSGGRVQEIIDLKPSMIRLGKPCVITITGKGNKSRTVPLLDAQVEHLKMYVEENLLHLPQSNMYPLFFGSKKQKLTRAGVSYILKKYIDMALKKEPTLIPPRITCHSIRHSKAMHLLRAEVPLIYIRDILGHESVKTTEVYARVDTEHKRKALEKAYVNINPNEKAAWKRNSDLIDWLKKF